VTSEGVRARYSHVMAGPENLRGIGIEELVGRIGAVLRRAGFAESK